MLLSPAKFVVIEAADGLARRAAHETRVRGWTDPHQERKARSEKHPVEDFLFEYYRFRPSWLRRWHPGPDVVLLGPAAHEYLQRPEYQEREGGVALNPAAFDPARRDTLVWVRG